MIKWIHDCFAQKCKNRLLLQLFPGVCAQRKQSIDVVLQLLMIHSYLTGMKMPILFTKSHLTLKTIHLRISSCRCYNNSTIWRGSSDGSSGSSSIRIVVGIIATIGVVVSVCRIIVAACWVVVTAVATVGIATVATVRVAGVARIRISVSRVVRGVAELQILIQCFISSGNICSRGSCRSIISVIFDECLNVLQAS